MSFRLDKYLAECGVGTRSEVKKLIRAKLVAVNGSTAAKPEMKIDEQADEVCLRGEKISYVPFEYYLFHKPAGCVSATEDRLHKTVLDYLTDTARDDLFPVGRLDIDTEGLLLITNDGVLAHELLSPAKHVAKTYYAKVAGEVTKEDVNLFEKGVDIGEAALTKPGRLKILAVRSDDSCGFLSEVELTITEGKFHQVKRMFQAVGKEVVYLKRTAMGPLSLPENLRQGEYRPLTEEEVASLRSLRETGHEPFTKHL